MTTWTRTPVGTLSVCGACGAALDGGVPVARVTIRGVRRALLRCAACAGPAPPDLPAVPVVVPAIASPPVRLRLVDPRVDWRARAAGMTTTREPGEEG